MNSTLVSIIVPVYNAEKTLQQCVDSIIRQTYTNIEIILIDDGSKDKSRDICDAYSEKDNRVIVYHSYNGGPGKSRNIGIDLATGKYLCFVDADDYVDEKEIEVLVEIIEQRGLDCIQFGFRYFENDIVSEKCVVSDVFPIDEVIYHDDIVDNLPHILRGGYLWFVWRNIYSLELIRQFEIRFPESFNIGEDSPFNLEYLLKCCQSLMVINNPLYFKRCSNSSLTGERYKKKYVDTLERRFDAISSILLDQGLYSEMELSYYTMNHTFPMLLENALHSYSLSDEFEGLVQSTMIKSALNHSSILEIKEKGLRLLAKCIKNHNQRRFLVIANGIRNSRTIKSLFIEYTKKMTTIFNSHHK